MDLKLITTIDQIITKMLIQLNDLNLKPTEKVHGTVASAYFINFNKKEISEIRIYIDAFKYHLEPYIKSNQMAIKINESLKKIHDFLYNETFQNPKFLVVYESFTEHKYLNAIRQCRFELLKIRQELLNVSRR